MNQINIDSLLQIGGSAKIEQNLKLDASQLYQALLQIGRDQDARISVQTPQGPLQIAIPTATAQQILQTAQQLTSVNPGNSGQNTGSMQGNGAAAQSNSSTEGPKASEAKIFVQLQPLGTEHIQLTVRLAGKSLQIPLQAAQLLQLLQQPAPGPQQHFSVQAQQLSARQDQLSLEWPVQLSRQGQYLQIQLAQGQPMRVDLAALAQAKNWPEQQVQSGRLQLSAEQGQLKIHLLLHSAHQTAAHTSATEKSSATKTPGNLSFTAADPAGKSLAERAVGSVMAKPHAAINPSAVPLKLDTVQQLLPQLARQVWPDQLGADVRHWLAQAKVTAPANQATSWQWQLKQPDNKQLLLELAPQVEPRQMKLAVSEISRPFQFLPSPSAAVVQQVQSDSRDLWRQWLPLSQTNPDLLADSPLLPTAVRQLLQEIRAQHPDAAKLQTQQQLMQQINAAMQFSPLLTPAQPNSAAGSLAIAIQLLLGRLGAQLPAERQSMPQKDKLQQLIGQLDRNQSAQLLRQLSGHSSQLQSAQIANLEQQSSPAQSQRPEQLLIQLPLLQQDGSRFAEMAISEREAEGSDQRNQTRCWQLTMKFDLGSQGEMLVQVRLIGKEVSLQFYADNEKTVQDTGQFLPLFKDRLTMQGLQVAEAGCQLGKIPEHLYQRGTSLLQVRV